MPIIRPKPATQRPAQSDFNSAPVVVTLPWEPAQAGFSEAEEAEFAGWLDHLAERGMVEDLTPHPLTDHIPGPGRPPRKR